MLLLAAVLVLQLLPHGLALAVAEGLALRNPALDLYRRRAAQYSQDAAEAERAAEQYAALAREAAAAQRNNLTSNLTSRELRQVGVGVWARAVGRISRLLSAPEPALAEKAAAKARAIYDERYDQYVVAEESFSKSAQGYSLRAQSDKGQAEELSAHAAQYRLQGDSADADTYTEQSQMLSAQADALQKLANDYSSTATRIQRVLPTIQDWADAAAKFAAWKANPQGVPAPQDMHTYTAAPPLEPPLLAATES